MQKIIAVDIDEVLSPFHEVFLRHHNATYGTDFAYPDPQDRYFLEQFTGEPSELVEAKIRDFVIGQRFQNLEPLPGAVESVRRLKRDGYGLVVVTARSADYESQMERFFGMHFPGMFGGVHKIPYFPGSALTPAASKIALCGELGAHYLIDDNLTTVRAAAEAGVGAILFGDYHWNRAEILPAGVTRCADWAKVLEYFNEQADSRD